MATVKVKLKRSSEVDSEGIILYQITHDRKIRHLLTDYHLLSSEWDDKRSMVVTSHAGKRTKLILNVRERIRLDMERIALIVRNLEANSIRYTIDDIIDEFKRYAADYSLFNFMERIISKLRKKGKIRTSETYAATLKSFRKFRKGEDIMLDSLSSEVMEDYEAWHHGRGVVPNTISFYNRILRAVYNRAVEDGTIENRYPFRHVYTGVDKTIKRALPLPIVRKLKSLDLSRTPSLDYARDMFIISFMLRGMSFIDMTFLRKTDLHDGYITYRRRKTGKQLIIAWTPEMQRILDKYPENQSDYLLPIIRNSETDERSAYRNAAYNINHNLKTLGKRAGVSLPLTLYVARHSWASAARAKGIPLSVISEGMGHDNESTTRIYLASLDTSIVDKANSLILKSI